MSPHYVCMRGSRKFCQKGSKFDNVTFLEGGPILNGGLVALWCFRESRPVLLINPIFFVIFQGVGVRTPAPLLICAWFGR